MEERGTYSALIPDAESWKQMVPCQAACPVHTDAGRYVQLIAIGEYRKRTSPRGLRTPSLPIVAAFARRPARIDAVAAKSIRRSPSAL